MGADCRAHLFTALDGVVLDEADLGAEPHVDCRRDVLAHVPVAQHLLCQQSVHGSASVTKKASIWMLHFHAQICELVNLASSHAIRSAGTYPSSLDRPRMATVFPCGSLYTLM